MKIVRSCMLILVLFGVWILPVGCGSGGSSGSTSVSTPTTVPTGTTVPLTQQVQNPVALFSSTGDNNGVIIEFPLVTSPTASWTGYMVFGINTLSNNVLNNSTANTFYLDSSGYIYTNFNGSPSIPSFIDSGSNGYFFPDTAIYQCSATSNAYGFYCTSGSSSGTAPDSQSLTATISDNKGDTSPTVDFSVDDAVYMFNTSPPNDAVFPTLGGPIPSFFDWGLPFFYGRNVYTSITSNGDGSYLAFLSYTVAPSGANVQPIYVNGGPTATLSSNPSIYANGAFTSVTVCVPGTSTCQTIDGVLVDTGSSGLRLLSSVLTLSLPAQQIGGGTLGECVQFADGSYIWGSVRTADVYLGGPTLTGEVAHSVPIHVLDSTFSTLPSDCSSSGGPEENDLPSLGANGILGVGSTQYDCGPACASSVISATYYTCPSS